MHLLPCPHSETTCRLGIARIKLMKNKKTLQVMQPIMLWGPVQALSGMHRPPR